VVDVWLRCGPVSAWHGRGRPGAGARRGSDGRGVEEELRLHLAAEARIQRLAG